MLTVEKVLKSSSAE